jgi:hypothetical protein
MPDGIRGGFGPVGRARFAEHACDMNGDRVGADKQRVADFLVGPANGEQSENFKLATGQTGRFAFVAIRIAAGIPRWRRSMAASRAAGKIVASSSSMAAFF